VPLAGFFFAYGALPAVLRSTPVRASILERRKGLKKTKRGADRHPFRIIYFNIGQARQSRPDDFPR
jgi:hypothetical protein